MALEDESTRKQQALERIAEANTFIAALQRARFKTLVESCAPAYRNLGSSRVIPSSLALDPSLLQLSAADFNSSDYSDQFSSVELEMAVESLSRQLRLHRKRIERNFDVFVSYNSEDRNEVRTIATYLQSAGLLPWFDQNELRPGQDWLTKLQEDIAQVKSCVVVIGRSGLGPWQKAEVNSAIQLFVKRQLPIVPVLLPSCSSDPQVPLFLHSVGWVDFRKLDPDPIAELIRSVESGDA